jgi:membrane associated rhomboid family serine protease
MTSEPSTEPNVVPPTTTQPTTTMPSTTTVPLQRTPPQRSLTNLFVLVFLGVLPSLGLPLLWFVFAGDVSVDVAAVVVVGAVVGVVAFVAYHAVLPKPGPVVVDAAAGTLSFPFARRGPITLPLTELLVCRADKGGLVLIEQRAAWVVPKSCFVDVDGASVVVDAVRAALGARAGDGAAYLARLDENAARHQSFHARRPLLTYALVGVCVAVFVVEVAVGAFDAGGEGRLTLLGANVAARVRAGEVWRLVTACVLHGSVVHLALNMSGLWSTGALLERWLSRSGFFIVVFVTGVAGHLASALWGRGALSVGFSGALFGMLGVLLWSTWRFRGSSGGPRIPLMGWAFLIVSNGFLSTIPVVDVVAHVGGFVAGVAVAELVAPRKGAPPRLSALSRMRGAQLCLALTLLAVGFAVARGVFGSAGQ